jgi:deoxyadenosine/deoxycytidine kinase
VAVAGNIGSGKSTLVDYLSTRYGFQPFPEPYELNPYLSDYYDDMERWAFHSQVAFLAQKFKVHLELQALDRPLVQDRTIYEDAEIFARHMHNQGWLSKRDWDTYLALYDGMCRSLRSPDLLIYLRCGVRGIRQRISKRGRIPEQGIPTRYLQSLGKLYDRWVQRYRLSPVLTWPSDRMNYLEDLVHRIEFEKALETMLSGGEQR